MDFAQLRDADLDSLDGLVKPWKTAAGKLKDGGDTATTDVGDRIRTGAWTGAAAGTAKTRVGFLEGQITAGKGEADVVTGLLGTAVERFTKARKRLTDLIADVHDTDGLSINDSGNVSVESPDAKDWLTGPVVLARQARLHYKAFRLNRDIDDAVGDARELDGQVATALRAAVDTDNDKLDFNPDAAADGVLPKGAHFDIGLPGGLDMYAKLAALAGTEPFDDRPAKEQSGQIGDIVKTEVERAGGQCKPVDGLMVCVGAPSTMYARGGTTFGDTFVSPYKDFDEFDSSSNKENLINHEKYHRDEQWRKDGISFARKYLTEEAHSKITGYTNKYEADAEEYGGRTGYDVKRPPGPGSGPTPSPTPGPSPRPPG